MRYFILFSLFLICGCTENSAARSWGGSATVELKPDEKLEMITWKKSNMWILTRPMRCDDNVETHTFKEDSNWGINEGTIKIVEKRTKKCLKVKHQTENRDL